MVNPADWPFTVGDSHRTINYIARGVGQAATSGDRRNYLVTAGSGGGKTHTLDAIASSLSRSHRQVLVLRPTLLGVGTYADLLYESLRSHDPDLADRAVRTASSWVSLEDLIAETVSSRPTVLVLDDFDRLFARIERVAHGRLRGWLDQAVNVTVVASAETTTNRASRSRRPWPWRSMFDITDLASLSLDDVADLVRAEAKKADRDDGVARPTQPWRHREIVDLYSRLGGNPRVWTIVAPHLVRSGRMDTPLPAVFDQLTPYYLPRLQALSPLSSRLVVALARAASPLTVTELAKQVRLAHQNTAAALSRLAHADWVIQQKPAADDDQRRRLYSVTEPSMREFIRHWDLRSATARVG
ncbi:hypothetical protein [[Mycobacterium] zoologicum]|uniref:hypothetical protein n=1 Tax=[Mycobacterium] zoologicum TaxID=2872311 RepID=UPI002CB19A7A|nr:hypothetical protein [Mycolicibacter sp. MYC101]MEB3065670.1 hypothetical protein [Mycolicibacter sp. MYC101]